MSNDGCGRCLRPWPAAGPDRPRTSRQSTGRDAGPRLLCALDEAGNVAALELLPEWATTGRGQGIQLLSVWHDQAQLVHRYGDRAATILNGHRAKVFLSGLADVGALELGSKLIGDQAITETNYSTDPGGRVAASQATSYRPLVPVEELRRLQPGEGIVVIYGHLRPARIQVRPHFSPREQRWRQRLERQAARIQEREARKANFHFDQCYEHAGHYTGWAEDLERRVAEHQAGRGARLIEVITQAGIDFRLARTRPGVTRTRERQLKRRGGASRHCPICQDERRTRGLPRRPTRDQPGGEDLPARPTSSDQTSGLPQCPPVAHARSGSPRSWPSTPSSRGPRRPSSGVGPRPRRG